MPQPKKPLRLGQLLDAQAAGVVPEQELTPADAAFLRHEYADAAIAYQARKRPSQVTAAKLGFCLAMARKSEEASRYLTTRNVGDHPEALVTLARILHDTQRGFGRSVGPTGKIIDALMARALAVEAPSQYVFRIAFVVLGEYGNEGLALADRACTIYPGWDRPRAIRASLLRRDGEYPAAELDGLMRFVTTTDRGDVLEEALRYAYALGRLDDAERIVAAVEALVGKAKPALESQQAIAEVRAMLDVQLGLTGDREAFARARDRLLPYRSSQLAESGDRLGVCKALLYCAIELNDRALIAEVATNLCDQLLSAPEQFDHVGVEYWGPMVSVDTMLMPFICEMTLPLHQHDAQVQQALAGDELSAWRIVTSLDCVRNRAANDDQVQLVRLVARELPPCQWSEGYAAFVDFQPVDYPGAGALLAALSEKSSLWSEEDNIYLDGYLDLVDPDQVDVRQLFRGALTWLQNTDGATGAMLLERWTDLMDEAGASQELEAIANLALARGATRAARASLDIAQGLTERDRALRVYGDPDRTRLAPADLTLLEAAALIALLRACTVDHVSWATTTLQQSGRDFEPTNKFVGVLFDLMSKGAIAIHASTPDNALTIEDGRLKSANLGRVHWRVSAYTLDLQRTIRALPREDWPDTWVAHAATLSRDLGTEELIAYAEYLLEDRRLPLPDREELRAVYRQQLDHLAIAQCYYLTHKTMRETLDYKARFRAAGQAQVAGRFVNLLRGNGEKAIEQGWDTRYQRVRDLPASLLHEALHDVLTGWGDRAFDQPVMSLPLESAIASTTKH